MPRPPGLYAEWRREHPLITFRLPREERKAFAAACKAEGKKQSDVLRDAVRVMLHPNGKTEAR